MYLPQLTVCRRDQWDRTLITLSGEIDIDSAPLVRASLDGCLRDGVRAIDIDLTGVTFCDCSGLNAFLRASQRTSSADGTLRLRHPPAMLARLLVLTGCDILLLGLPSHRMPPPAGGIPAVPAPSPSRASVPLVPGLSGDLR